MEVSTNQVNIEGRSGFMAAGIGLNVGEVGFRGAGGGVPPPSADRAVGDIKMAVRTDDHLDGSMTWFFCDGRAINRVTYATLFALCGVQYGVGDGLTTFNIPRFNSDGAMQGFVPMGNAPLGATGGVEAHAHSLNEIMLVFHNFPFGPWSDINSMAQIVNPGIDVAVSDSPHVHGLPAIAHAGAPPSTNNANVVSPYLAVGFFIRVL